MYGIFGGSPLPPHTLRLRGGRLRGTCDPPERPWRLPRAGRHSRTAGEARDVPPPPGCVPATVRRRRRAASRDAGDRDAASRTRVAPKNTAPNPSDDGRSTTTSPCWVRSGLFRGRWTDGRTNGEDGRRFGCHGEGVPLVSQGTRSSHWTTLGHTPFCQTIQNGTERNEHHEARSRAPSRVGVGSRRGRRGRATRAVVPRYLATLPGMPRQGAEGRHPGEVACTAARGRSLREDAPEGRVRPPPTVAARAPAHAAAGRTPGSTGRAARRTRGRAGARGETPED